MSVRCIISLVISSGAQSPQWPNGLERWLGLATGRFPAGFESHCGNFASELWQFRLPRFATMPVFFRRPRRRTGTNNIWPELQFFNVASYLYGIEEVADRL